MLPYKVAFYSQIEKNQLNWHFGFPINYQGKWRDFLGTSHASPAKICTITTLVFSLLLHIHIIRSTATLGCYPINVL